MILAIVVLLLSVSGIGVGFAYDTTFVVSDNVVESSSEYCQINSDAINVMINGNRVQFTHYSGEDESCKITYAHHSLSPQSGIVNMDVTIKDPGVSLTPIVISMTSSGKVIGSTTLSGTGDVLSGTISGIGPISNKGSLTFSLILPLGVSFSSNATIDLNFVAYPLSEGS